MLQRPKVKRILLYLLAALFLFSVLPSAVFASDADALAL